MSFRRRALFLAGLFVAVSCSDAGNPLDPDGREVPDADPEMVLQAMVCDVDANAGTMECRPLEAGAGDALGAINIGGGSAAANTYAVLTSSNSVRTATSHTLDVTIKNNMVGQIIGTTNGTTAHAYGMKAYYFNPASPTAVNPIVTQRTNPALPASVTMNGDGSQKFTGAGSAVRPYFQYAPQILLPGQTSAAKTWSFTLNNVNTYQLTIYISTEVRWPQGWLNIVPEAPIVQEEAVDTLTAQVRGAFGQRLTNEPLTWSSSDPSVVTVTEAGADSLAEIVGVSEGTAWVKAVSNHANPAQAAARRDSVLVTVSPKVETDSISALSNVTVYLSADSLPAQTVLDTTYTTAEGGTATVGTDGTLSYLSPAGYAGKDTVVYNVSNGVWTVQGRVIVQVDPSNYWYVQAGTDDPSSTEDNSGRDRYPFRTMAAAVAAASTGDSIFVLAPENGTDQVSGAATLKAGQAVLGEGISDDYTVVLNDTTVTIFDGTGAAPGLTHSSGTTLTLASTGRNQLRGFAVGNTGGTAIGAADLDSVYVRQLSVSATGPALNLSSGHVDAEFITLSSLNSTSGGLLLTGLTGSITAAAGSIGITGAGGPAVNVSGSLGLSYPGDISQTTSNPLLNVSGHSGGTIALSGTLTASNGTGLQFNNADGSYTFTGAVALNGGDAGLDVLGGSDGVFTFAAASITTPSGGPAVNVVGGTPALVYRGEVTHNSGRAVLVDGISADSVVLRAAINSGTAGTPTGQGILVQNVSGGRVVLDSVKTLFTGTNPAVTLTSNTGGLVRFGGSLSITTTTGAGFTASGSDTVVVTGVNSVTTTTGVPVSLSNVHTGINGVSFSTVSTSGGAANGIVLSSLAGGAGFQATGGTISGTSGAAVQLTSMGAVDSTSIRGMTLSRSGGTGAVISGTNFGKLHVLNTSVTAASGPGALDLNTGTLSGTLSTLSSNSSTGSGVSLTSVAGSLNASAGSINTAGAAAFLLSGGTVGGTVSATVAQATAAQPLLSVINGHNGTITFAGNLTATNGTGLQFTDADGTYSLTGSLSLGGGDAGIDIAAASTGTIDVNPAGGNTAAITSPSGVAISVVGGSADLTYRGNVTQGNSASLLSVTSAHNGDLSFPSGTVNASNGNGLQFDNADGTYVFGGTVTLNGGDAGIDVTNNSAGTFTFPATSNIVSPSTGNLVSILNSAPTFTYSGAFTKANNNVTGINIQSNTGGSITFNGSGVTKSISSGSAAAVNLSSNAGASILFSGGGLSITSGSGAGFTATGGGTVNVTGAGNVISSATGTALNVQNTTIGASGLSFASVSHSGGATGNGIVLDNTGALGGVQITGTGGVPGSGGTITNTQGADGSTQGAGIYLNNTRAISLAFMALSGHANWAIRGNNVVGFTMNKVRITGTNGTSTTTDDGSVYFTELTGSASITGSFIDGGFEDGVLVDNTTGTLNRITFDGDTIGSSSGISGDGLRLEASGGTLNATIQNTRFARAAGDMFQHNIIGNAQSDLDFVNNTLVNGHPAISGGGGGVTITAAESGDLTYDIDTNVIRGSKGVALLVNKPFGGSPGNGTMTGFIRNNTIGTAGATQNGSSEGSGIQVGLLAQGQHTTLIQNNQVYDYANFGIFVNMGGTAESVTGLTHNGTLNATVLGNTVAEPTAPAGGFAQNGFHVNSGSNDPDAYQMCVDFGHASTLASRNTVNGSGALGGTDFRIRHRFFASLRMPGYTGSTTDNAAVVSYLQARNNNSGTTTGNAANQVGTHGGGFFNTSPANSACPQP